MIPCRLVDVYAVLTWYLRHKVEVADYLRKAELRNRMHSAKGSSARQPDRTELRDRLMARQAQKEVGPCSVW